MKKVEIIERKQVYQKLFFRLEETRLRHETFSGGMSEPIMRICMDRGDGVAALLHDPQASTVLMVEQFRYPAYLKFQDQPDRAWLLEIPAGIMEDGEDPKATMLREITEETGYQIPDLEHISTFFLSPGGASERIHVYYGQIAPEQKISAGGGLTEEGEDLRLVTVPVAEVMGKIADGSIQDAKSIIALQWLLMRA